MRNVGVLLLGLGLFVHLNYAVAAPLDNWHWRNPLPNGNPLTNPHQLNGVVFDGAKFVAVGASGVVSISTDTTNWVESATATTNDLYAVAYGGGKFVAVGSGGVIESSVDGATWVLQNSGITYPLDAVTYAKGKFVVVGGVFANRFLATNGVAVISSADAANWTPATSGLTGAVAIAGSSTGFVALPGSAIGTPYTPNQAFFSSDGLTWTSTALTAPGSVFSGAQLNNAIVAAWNGSFYVGSSRYATSMSADMFIFTSTDGTTWATNVLGNAYTGAWGFDYDFFTAGGNCLMAVGAAENIPFIQVSFDGISWSQTNNIPYSNIQNNIGATAGAFGSGTSVMVAPANFNYSLPPIFTSTDGLNWANRQHAPVPPSGPTYTFTCIASNNGVDVVCSGNLFAISSNGLSYAVASNTPALASVTTFGNQFVGVGNGGTVYVSTNGLAWTQRTSATANNLHGVTVGNGLLVAVGDAGTVQTSASGLVWTIRTSGTSLALNSIIYSNGLFVAVGQQGTVLTSPDGLTWTGQYSGVLSNLVSVAYGSAGFTAVGSGGAIVTSPDGINWIQQNPGLSVVLESVSFGNGYYLAVGNNSAAVSSPDGVNWTLRKLGATGGQNFYGTSFISNRFEVVGANGAILESDPIAPLFNLQIGRQAAQNSFQMFATPGTSYRLQGCTSLSLSNWADLATFNNAPGIMRWTNGETSYNQRYFRLVSP